MKNLYSIYAREILCVVYCFLFVQLPLRAQLQDESRFRKYDWLHFIPFVLHTAELMPFFLQTAAYKLNYLQHLLVDLQGVIKLKEGLLPDYFHTIAKFVQGNIYVCLQWYLIWQFRCISFRHLLMGSMA